MNCINDLQGRSVQIHSETLRGVCLSYFRVGEKSFNLLPVRAVPAGEEALSESDPGLNNFIEPFEVDGFIAVVAGTPLTF